MRGTGEQRQYWGAGNKRKQIFDFVGIGEQADLFHGNKGTGTPLEGPHYFPLCFPTHPYNWDLQGCKLERSVV